MQFTVQNPLSGTQTPQQTCMQAIAITCKPLQYEAKRWNTHHPNPPYPQCHHPPHNPLWSIPVRQHDHWATRTAVTGCNWHFRPSPRVYYPKEVTISHSEVLTPHWGGGSPAIREYKFYYSCPSSNCQPGDDPCASTITPVLPISPVPKTLQAVRVIPIHHPKTPLWPKPAELSEELLKLQEKLTVALENLYTVRAALDLHQWELDLQVELPRCLNDAQFNRTMRETTAHCSTTVTALKEAYQSNVMALDWEEKAEEGREHQALQRLSGQSCKHAHQRPRDLHVSSPATHQWCAADWPYGNDNCGSAISHGGHNNYTKGHPYSARESSGTIRW